MSTLTLPVTDPLELIPSLADEPVTRRDVLLKAADLIEEEGWTTRSRGMLVDGPFCLLGAIAHVSQSRSYENGTMYDMTPPASLIGVDSTKAYRWNDSTAQTAGRVTAALRRLADGATWEEATA